MIKINGMKKIYRNTDFQLDALKGIDLHIKKVNLSPLWESLDLEKVHY